MTHLIAHADPEHPVTMTTVWCGFPEPSAPGVRSETDYVEDVTCAACLRVLVRYAEFAAVRLKHLNEDF